VRPSSPPMRPSCVASFNTHPRQFRQASLDLVNRLNLHDDDTLAPPRRWELRHLGYTSGTVHFLFILRSKPQSATPFAILQLHRNQHLAKIFHMIASTAMI
jgi:hypothetical protein